MFQKIDNVSIIERFRDNFLRLKGLWRWGDDKLTRLLEEKDFPDIILQIFDIDHRSACGNSKSKDEISQTLDYLFKLEDNKEELNKLIRNDSLQIGMSYTNANINKIKASILPGIQEEAEIQSESEDFMEETQLLTQESQEPVDYDNLVVEMVVGGGKRKKKKRTKRKRKRKKKRTKRKRKNTRKKTRKKRKKKRKNTRKRK